jgi:Ni/Co efflux regulator RcnB
LEYRGNDVQDKERQANDKKQPRRHRNLVSLVKGMVGDHDKGRGQCGQQNTYAYEKRWHSGINLPVVTKGLLYPRCANAKNQNK